METSYIRAMSNFPILVKTPLIFSIPWAPAPFPKRGVRALLVPYSVDPDQLASQKLADLDLHS